MKQVDSMVQKIRKEAMKGAPIESTLIWENPVEMPEERSVSEGAVYKERVEAAMSTKGSASFVTGMVLSGSVSQFDCCRNCEGEEFNI